MSNAELHHLLGGLPEEYLPCDRRYLAEIETGIAQAAETIAAELSGAYAIDVSPAFIEQLINVCHLIPTTMVD